MYKSNNIDDNNNNNNNNNNVFETQFSYAKNALINTTW